MRKYAFWMGLGVFIALLAVAGLALAQPYRLRGSIIDPPQPAPAIALNGFDLSAQRGKVVLLFFGYTTCPDVCPATLGEMKQVLQRLGGQAQNVQVVFVTVDPQRDTPEKMQRYTAAFDPRIAGVTGTEEELQPIWQAYGVYREIRQGGTAAGYLVDHSARVYLIDPEGFLRATYPFGTPVEDLLSDVRFLLKP